MTRKDTEGMKVRAKYTIAMIWLCVKRTSNVHKDKTGISKFEKHLRLLCSGTKLFLLPLSLKVLRHKERGAQSFYSGFFICPPPTRVAPATKVSASKRKPTVLLSRQVSSQLFNFLQIPKILTRFRCVTSFALCNPVSYLGYCDISE